MKDIQRNMKKALVILLVLFLLLVIYLCYAMFFYGDRWFSNSYNSRVRLDGWQPKIIPGDILDRNGNVLATTQEKVDKNPKTGQDQTYYYRSYYKGNEEAKSIAHVVGFHDSKLGRSGVEAFHIRYLMGYNNSFLERIYQKALLPQERGNDVVLTIDIELQKYIDNLMGQRKGSVVVMDIDSGEILAMVSHPTYNPNQLSDKMEGDVLYNRATEGLYPPGSVFKIVTAASALQNIEGIMERQFNCDGSININGETIPCFNGEKHGTINLTQAMLDSCNVVFAKLGIELGRDNIIKTAEAFGFNQDFLFRDIRTAMSKIPLKNNEPTGKLGWSSIGQGDVLTTPLHMAMISSAIANDGIMMEPRLLLQVIGRDDRILEDFEPRFFRRVTTPQDANIIREMLIAVVSNGTGKKAKIQDISIAGKTGTAEKQLQDGGWNNNAWFVGFAPAEEPRISIAIVLEDMPEGQTGGLAAAPLSANIIKKAVELGY